MSHEILTPRRLAAVVLLPFGLAYGLSYALRNINALIATSLSAELDIGTSKLGLLTSVLFLAMALVQLPLGAALDRYGPRRVQSMLLLLAVIGAIVTSVATTFYGVLLGRILIGIGTSTSLMAGLKAVVMAAPPTRRARANGFLVMIGAFGAVAVTAPADALLSTFGWRGLFQLAAGIAILSAALILILAPDRQHENAHRRTTPVKLSTIYADPRFRALAPLSALTVGSSWSLQSLWAGPWLTHVAKLDHVAVVHHLLVLGLALALGAAGLGWLTDRLKLRGFDGETVLALMAAASLAAVMALVLELPLPPLLPWSIIAIAGAATTISYAILPGYFAAWMSGRANAALDLLHLLVAFGLQTIIGAIIDRWPAIDGHPPAEAFRVALFTVAVLQALALTWFAWARRRRAAPVLTVRHALLRVLDPVPARSNPYDTALVKFSERLSASRADAIHWRRAALSLATLCLMLTGFLGALQAREAQPYIVTLVDLRVAQSVAGDGHATRP